MGTEFVRNVIREHAKVNRPVELDLWPVIRDQSQSGYYRGRITSLTGQVVPKMTQPQDTTSRKSGPTVAARGMPRLRVNTSMALIALLALSTLAVVLVTGDRYLRLEGGFLPVGKVRHMVVTHTYNLPGQLDQVLTEEVWLTNGKNHIVMYSTYPSDEGSISSTWVEEDSVYIYNPRVFTDNRVRKYPYDARHLELYTPNELSNLLTLPNAVITTENTLGGHPVRVIEAIADRTKPTWLPGFGGFVVTDYKLWVDKETSQVLQRQHITTVVSGSDVGKSQTQTFRVTENELQNRSEFPPDFFAFKLPKGTSLLESPNSFFSDK